MKKEIIIRFTVEGTHRWAACDIESVAFLRNEHRHIFYIECRKEVSHSDRDIEIILFKREVTEYLKRHFGEPCAFKELSCEMIAENLIQTFGLSLCMVLEDNENGAILYND